MPGTTRPTSGIQGFHALIDALRLRLASLEAWQRRTRGLPAGTITRWPGPSAPPGALACDGSSIDPTAYPLLAAALGSSTLPSLPGSPIYIIWT